MKLDWEEQGVIIESLESENRKLREKNVMLEQIIRDQKAMIDALCVEVKHTKGQLSLLSGIDSWVDSWCDSWDSSSTNVIKVVKSDGDENLSFEDK